MTKNQEKLLDLAHDHAARILIGAPKDTELLPVWCCVSRNGESNVVATPFVGPDEITVKNAVAAQMRHFMSEWDVVRYSFMSEAWTVSIAKHVQARRDKRPPSQRDDRVEVVMIMAVERGEEPAQRIYEIARDWETGQVTELRLRDDESTVFSGRFANLLEDR